METSVSFPLPPPEPSPQWTKQAPWKPCTWSKLHYAIYRPITQELSVAKYRAISRTQYFGFCALPCKSSRAAIRFALERRNPVFPILGAIPGELPAFSLDRAASLYGTFVRTPNCESQSAKSIGAHDAIGQAARKSLPPCARQDPRSAHQRSEALA